MTTVKKVTIPKPVFLKTPSDFTRFEETLRTVCEKYLSLDWDWTFKVGGKVQKKIEEGDSESDCLKIIYEKEENVNIHLSEISSDDGPKGPSGKIFSDATGKISKSVLDALGKRGWELEKMMKNEEKFFSIKKNTYEDKDLLSVRKEIWDWCEMCRRRREKFILYTFNS